jgi:predicted O-methyltransferase YrrM
VGVKEFLPQRVRHWLGRAKRAALSSLTRPDLYDLRTLHRVGVVYTAPSDMQLEERFCLYSLIRGFRPERALEIGVFHGGSGCIIANAMEDNGKGIAVGIDPQPKIQVRARALHGRYRLLVKPSPEGLPEARELAGGPFEFVLVDGLHLYSQVCRDIEGILPHLCEGAFVMFHDAFHYGVGTAINEALSKNPLLRDCGFPCRMPRLSYDAFTPYNGVRLLRYAQTDVYSPAQVVRPFYEAQGRTPPIARADVLDHDQWYCRTIAPCPRCKAAGVSKVS